MMTVGVQSEFSRLVGLHQLSTSGLDWTVEADSAECAALRERFGLEALHGLRAQLRVEWDVDSRGTKIVRVRGSFLADLRQVCVVTLEPFEAQVSDDFEAAFASPADLEAEPWELEVSALEDVPEPLKGEEIDVGELVAEHLALALDPYPRRPGAPIFEAEFVPTSPAGGEAAGPFAALGQLKGKM